MTYSLSAESIAACRQLSIDIDPQAKFGWQGFSHETIVETPANIRAGTFDIDFIGAFSYLGGRETFMRHASCVECGTVLFNCQQRKHWSGGASNGLPVRPPNVPRRI